MSPDQDIKIRDIASLYCSDKSLEKNILELKVHDKLSSQKNTVIPVLKIVNVVHKYINDIDITILGDTEILVYLQKDTSEGKVLQVLKTFIVCLVLFLGGGLAIINFHADVNMDDSLKIIYHMVTGEETDKPLILQIPYSLGIGLGMTVFFNHVFQKKWKKEPSPLELEMFTYEKSIDDYILNNTKHN